VETRVLILELLDFVDDVVDELGSRDQISYASDIKNGTGAAKQLAVFEKNARHYKSGFITDEFTKGL
jgi:carboxylate-amine ligase